MSDSARDLLVRGIAAAKAKQHDEARFYLKWVLTTNADREQQAQAWLWLSEIAGDPVEKRHCLEECLVLNPTNPSARRSLAILDGRLDPAEIIDPDRLSAQPQPEPEAARAQRFVCVKCGGKMAYKPDGQALRCEYCGIEQTLLGAMNEGGLLQEHDFMVALATVKGHTRPVDTRPFACQACGASFMLAPGTLSLTCPYCGSAHVVLLPETRQLIPPEAQIPLAVSAEQARRAFHTWCDQKGLRGKVQVTPVRGLYLPAWTFDVAGEIRWQCYVYREEDSGIELGGLQINVSGSRGGRKLVREEGSHLVYADDIIVPASHKLPADLLMAEAERFKLAPSPYSPTEGRGVPGRRDGLLPYDPAYLADWPAEVYEISVSDASLVARRVALDQARSFVNTRIGATLGDARDLRLNSIGLVVESYKLILLPVWVARYRYEGEVYHVLVNGQTAEVRAQEPPGRLRRFFSGLFT